MNTPDNLPTPNPFLPKMSTSREWLLFAAGFLGWYLAHGLAWFGLMGGTLNGSANSSTGDIMLGNFLNLPVNAIALLIFALIRPTRPIALGILAALAVTFVFSLVLGLFNNGICGIRFF